MNFHLIVKMLTLVFIFLFLNGYGPMSIGGMNKSVPNLLLDWCKWVKMLI